MELFCILLAFFLRSPSVVHAEGTSLYVGVLEATKNGVAARVAFRKDAGKWMAFKTDFASEKALGSALGLYPSPIDWTVVFDGKKLGEVRSRNPRKLSRYSEIGLQALESGEAKAPRVSTGTKEFAGWMGTPNSRPLLLVSKPNFKDPEHWKPGTPSTEEAGNLRRALHRILPKVDTCEGESSDKPSLVAYSDADTEIFKSYRSAAGDLLAGLRINSKLNHCDGPTEGEWSDHWFHLPPGKAPVLLGNQMTAMDAADLDDDGRSEWIFFVSKYNEDGYALFYDHFSKSAFFTWNYQ